MRRRVVGPHLLAIGVPLFLFVAAGAIPASADFLPSRICKVRTRQCLDQGWKFLKADSANASAAGFNDATWQTVNLPHSAQYDPPTPDGEQRSVPQSTGWNGVHWYRKTFTLPAAAHNRKVFLEFDGAMQMAKVWVNGTVAGTHDACGFTGFSLDISGLVNRTGTNVVAVRLDCRYRDSIPPGRAGTFSTAGNNKEYPDFFLYSGLYRDVWLVCTDNVYIPINGQKIATPVATTAGSRVRVRTTVRNDSSATQSATVTFCIVNSSDGIVATCSQTAQVGANSSTVFDRTSDSLPGLQLWSPESPVLYRVFTRVSINGQVVDDFVDRFGVRSLNWTRTGGFYLNGQRYLMKGVCMHQEFAWVENAVPRSRFFEEVRLAKELGANSIRCSHYPRSPAFYNACDELGVLCEVELPSWGCCSATAYPPSFWNRMNVAAGEMIDAGYNHPSIIVWGFFNEANPSVSSATFKPRFDTLHATIKRNDSTRCTALYGNSEEVVNYSADLYGMNYAIRPASMQSGVKGAFVAEYHEGWIKWGYRGDTARKNDASLNGALSENRFAADRWSGSNNWTQILAAWNSTTEPVPAGGHMWCFVDYWSPVQDYPMGALDIYRIPKKAFYTFRNNWTSAPYDTFIVGLAPTRIQLDADLTSLVADSTDITRLVASLRDASGKCAFAARNVTLQVSGPADCFDTLTRTTIAGKIGWVLKSRNTAGTISAIVTSSGLTPDTVTITSSAPDNSSLPFIWPPTGISRRPLSGGRGQGLLIKQGRGFLSFDFSVPRTKDMAVKMVSIQGKTVIQDISCRRVVTVDTKRLPAGCYGVLVGRERVGRILLMN